MSVSKRVAHVSTVHHPRDPRIYRKEIGTLRKSSIETWFIARNVDGAVDDEQFLGLNNVTGARSRVRRHFEAWRHLRELRPEVIHIHDPELIPLARLARARLGCKVIYDMHEDYAGRRRPGGRLLRLLERWCFRWADHVVLAESSYDQILRGFSVPSTPVLNYMLPPENEPSPSSGRPVTLVYTGTLSNCRGLSNMVDLAAAIKAAELPWKVRIAGVCHLSDERRDAEQRIRDEGLGSVIERVGWDRYVGWSELMDLLVDADIGLALFEPLPNHTRSILSKFYEYIYFGLPVIASDFPLWRAFFEASGCGLLVNSGDSASIVARVEEMIESDEYQEMVTMTKRSRPKYLWSEMEPRLRGLYEDVLRG